MFLLPRRTIVSSFIEKLKRNAISYPGGRAHASGFLVGEDKYESDCTRNDEEMRAKNAALSSALSGVLTGCEEGFVPSLRNFFGFWRRIPVIPTGSLKLDLALGIGGLPKGRIIEIYGREASGKTTLAFQIIKQAQKNGGYCAYFNVENSLEISLVEGLGVDPKTLLVVKPNSAENLLSMVDTLTRSQSVDVIVVDTVAALIPQEDLDKPLMNVGRSRQRNLQADVMNRALRKINHSLCRSETVIIFLNQIRWKPKKGGDVSSSSSSSSSSSYSFGSGEETTCGGNALRFYAAMRMRTVRKRLKRSSGGLSGIGISVEVVKNKMWMSAAAKAELEIELGRGVRVEREVLELGCEYGLIWMRGSDYVIEGSRFGDAASAESYLGLNTIVRDRLVAILRTLLFSSPVWRMEPSCQSRHSVKWKK